MENKGNEWISISDMMAGVMMIFLLIAVSYMVVISAQNRELERRTLQMSEIAQAQRDLQSELYADLNTEFAEHLNEWNAEISDDGAVRFKEPDVLFDTGKSQLKTRFKEILDDFFPRYVRILQSQKYKNEVEEIRIEGHTSSEWINANTLEARYLGNAELSQARALEVLKYCFSSEKLDSFNENFATQSSANDIESKNIESKNIESKNIESGANGANVANGAKLNKIEKIEKIDKDWLISVLRANGLSFAQPLGSQEQSRRVEFRATTKSKKAIFDILKAGETQSKSEDSIESKN